MRYVFALFVVLTSLVIPSVGSASNQPPRPYVNCGNYDCLGGGGHCGYIRDPFTGQMVWVCS